MKMVNVASPGNRLDLRRRLAQRARPDAAVASSQRGGTMAKRTSSPQDISTPLMISPEQYRALRDGAGLVNRSDRGRLRLTGADRRDYLQGLLTNDIAALTPGTGCYACLLTAQGRMIADMYVVETGDAILMDLERAVTARVGRTSRRSSCSARTSRSRTSADRLAQLGVFGPDAGRRRQPRARVARFAPTTAISILRRAETVLGNRSVHLEHADESRHGRPPRRPRRTGFRLVDRGRARRMRSAQALRRRRCCRRRIRKSPRSAGSRPAGLFSDKDMTERHDSARGRHRGSRDQPDEGLLRRPGDHHPRAAPRPRPRGAPARRVDARTDGERASSRRVDPRWRSRDWHRSRARRCRPRWGGRSRSGYVHRDFVEPGTAVRRERRSACRRRHALPFVATSH